MEGERQMEQTRKLLADAFDKDPIKTAVLHFLCGPFACVRAHLPGDDRERLIDGGSECNQ